MDGESNALNYVSEIVLKKRRNKEQSAVQRAAQVQDRVLRRYKNKKVDPRSFIKKPEQFVWEFRQKELDFVRMKNRMKVQKLKRTTVETDLLFVIRINGSNDMHPATEKILKTLRLSRIFTGVFLRTNDEILDMLVRVEPYVTYGHPNLRSIRELIFKKGCGRVDGVRTPLTDNNIIEKALGEHGIICIEDIIHEIEVVGPHFKEASRFLLPFRLKKPEGGKVLQKSKRRFKDGGDAGNRGDLINDLISKMNCYQA